MGSNKPVPVKLNAQEKDQLDISGYRLDLLKCIITVCVALTTFGVLFLIMLWRKNIKMRLFYRQCPPQEATKVQVKDAFKQVYIEDVVTTPFSRYFINKKVKYEWDETSLQFAKIRPFDEGMRCDEFHTNLEGLKASVIGENERIYGSNLIEISLPSTPGLIRDEISNPLYFLQAYTLILWLLKQYFEYSGKILALTAIAVGSSVWETRKQIKSLKERVQVSGSATVIRGGVEFDIPMKLLVPGDLISINPFQTQEMLCDAVLISGLCSMDESMLTGENYPVTKLAVPNNVKPFDYNQHKRHLLYCGTKLIQGHAEANENSLKAVVIRTGFMTHKGDLIKAVLFPKPMNLGFYHDILKCAMLMGSIGICGSIYSSYSWLTNGATVKEIILSSLDIASFAVPPSLPAALTCVSAFAKNRLKNNRIFCLGSRHIVQSGGVDVVCFDKTGTLTETEIEFEQVVPIQQSRIGQPLSKIGSLSQEHPLVMATATCHSLILVNRQLVGHSIDRKMFKATHWKLKNGPIGLNSEYGIETPILVSSPLRKGERLSATINEVAVLKQFPFESSAKRMTVVTLKKGSDHFTVYMKGAPETIASLCNPNTVPANYRSVLRHYTTQGYRVFAVATKVLSPHQAWNEVRQMNRDQLESEAELIGLLVVRNQLKKETTPTIRALNEAQIKTVMITGDNLQTAVMVARECTMVQAGEPVIHIKATLTTECLQISYKYIPSPSGSIGSTSPLGAHNGNYCFALDAHTFNLLRVHNLTLFEKVIHRAKVYARMATEDKQYLVGSLQRIGRRVAMVGDGCNDCEALRTADTGLFLSMAGGSIAAPFIAQEMNISCILPLIREGRTMLESSFGTFLYVNAMSLVLLVGGLLLFSISSKPSDFQFFVFDLGIMSVPYFVLGNSPPSDYLHPQKPQRNLWAFLPMFSLFTFIIWQIAVMLIGWFYCHSQNWFVPYMFEAGLFPPNPSYEETTTFWLMCIGTIAAVFVYAPSKPYSKSIFNNYILMVWAVESFALTLCLMFITNQTFVNFLNFKSPPNVEYSLMILLLGIASGLWCFIWEKYFIRGLLQQFVCVQLKCNSSSIHRYEEIEKTLINSPDWPRMEGELLISGENVNEETVKLLHCIPVEE